MDELCTVQCSFYCIFSLLSFVQINGTGAFGGYRELRSLLGSGQRGASVVVVCCD